MNTQTVILNKSNVIDSNKTKYVYKFPKPLICKEHEIALASLSIYYSWRNIDSFYNNNIFSYTWWNHLGVLTRHDITIPNGNYSIRDISNFLQYQMTLKGHYVIDNITLKKKYFIEFQENAIYYACQIKFTSMYQKNSIEQNNYTNENPASQDYDINGNLINIGWDYPSSSKQYPQIIFDSVSNGMAKFLGFNLGTYPQNAPMAIEHEILGGAPEVYPVSSILIQSNMCRSEISVPDNIMYTFSQGETQYGALINKEPSNLIWMRIPEGSYSQLEIQFIDQNYLPMKILDDQINVVLLIREI